MECGSVFEDKNRCYTWSRLRDWRRLYKYVLCALSCHCRQQVRILPLLLSHWLPCSMQDSWAQRGRDVRRIQEAGLVTDHYQTTHCVNLSRSLTNTALSRKSVCSLCHLLALMDSKSYRQFLTWRQSVTFFALYLVIALHFVFAFLPAIAVMIRLSWEVLKLVQHSLVSLSLHIRLDVHDQRWQLSVSLLVLLPRRAHIGFTTPLPDPS